MKKIITLLIVALLISTAGIVAFADEGELLPDWFKEMVEWKKDQIDEAVDNGDMTEEEGEYWKEHFEYMEEYHQQNGFPNARKGGYGRPGGCHGGGYRKGPRFNNNFNNDFNNRQNGFGPGMMDNGWGNSYQ